MAENNGKNPKNKHDIVSYGSLLLPPVIPGLDVQDLCNKIDDFYDKYPKRHKKQKASDLIKGAFYAMRSECRTNSDWMSQSANSAREVLYPFWGGDNKSDSLLEVFKKYTVDSKELKNTVQNEDFTEIFKNLEITYRKLTDITHHGVDIRGKGFLDDGEYLSFSESDFEDLMYSFVSILNKVVNLQQIHIHKLIDVITSKRNWTENLKKDLNLVLNINHDAKSYFFTKAPEKRLFWLWENGFLDKIKEKSEDPTQFGGQRFPELDYLVKATEKVPDKVVKIMLEVEVSKEHFNPGVLNRFVWICNTLPPKELALIIPKIKKENWVQLMSAFNSFGFEYERMLKILKDAKDYESILTLAETILTVRSKEEMKKDGYAGVSMDKPFYFNDLSHTKVFEYLSNVDSEHMEQVLALAMKTMSGVIELGDKAESNDKAVFPIRETFHLQDVDFFTLELNEKERLSHRDDVRNLAAVIKGLAQKTIGSYDTDPYRAQELYKKYFISLPDSRSMWRLKLFVMTLYPNYFKDELKEAFFMLFDVMDEGKSYYEIISGAEYERALQKGFPILSDEDKRKYTSSVIEYFVKEDKEKKNENENWHLQYGADLLSVIMKELTKEEIEIAEKAGLKINPDHEPEPSIKMNDFTAIISKWPITQEEFDKMTIEEIVKALKSDWTPEKLNEQNETRDFHRPRNVEGAGSLLQKGLNNRFDVFIESSEKFFDEQEIDAHYTHAFLRGAQEAIKSGKRVNGDEWLPLIKLLRSLIDANLKNEKRKEGFYDTWIADWKAVYYVIPDILQELLSEKDGQVAIGDFKKYRAELLEILQFLLIYPDPKPEDEKIETAKSKTSSPGNSEFLVSDPYSMAINSVRGRAFQAFLMFVHQDGKELEDKKIKISEDVKKIYEDVLEKENTRANMFMFGHYIPSFYFRDTEWVRGLLPKIFPTDKEKKYLYLAAWEGYLTQTLYKEIFFDQSFQDLYKRGINLTDTKYPNQKHFKDLDEALATHLALAFAHLGLEAKNELFKLFWDTTNTTRHHEFISFLGRSILTRDQAGDEWMKENNVSKKKLIEFWDWALKNITDPKVFDGFGFWVNQSKEILDDKVVIKKMAETLEKSNGSIDWDYGLIQRLSDFAEKDSKNTLSIIENYLLDKDKNLNQNRGVPMFHVDKEIKEALEVIYQKDKLKADVENLVNALIEKGSSTFWGLKDVIK